MFYYNIRTDNISLFVINWFNQFSSLLFVFSVFLVPFMSVVLSSVLVVACALFWLCFSVVLSFSRWKLIEIPRTSEKECKMFIASSEFLLNDSSVVLGLSRKYREFGLICVELSLLPEPRVISGIYAASMWISVHLISSDEVCGNGTVSDIVSGAVVSATILFGVLMFVVEYSICDNRSGSAEFETCPVGISLPSFVASGFCLGLDNRLVSGVFCSAVAFISILFAAIFWWWRFVILVCIGR